MRQNDSIDDETKIEQQRHLLFQKYLQLFNHEIYYTSIELETLEEIRGLEKSVWPPEIMLRFFGESITYTTTARIHRNAPDAFAFAMLKECEAYQVKDMYITLSIPSASFLVNSGFRLIKLDLRENSFGDRELRHMPVGKGDRDYTCQIVDE